jgi:16S rRNA (cytosine967-C5)-methyltransferase
MPVSAARWAAFRILKRVEARGRFAADLLHSPQLAGLESREVGLTEELVLGVLRRQGELDAAIATQTGRPPEKLDLEVRLALRLGLYQLRHLDRIPPRAAVSESVELVRRARKASAAALVNAVLRHAAQEASRGESRPELALPGWLLERWRQFHGRARADAAALACLARPPVYLRLNTRFTLSDTITRLTAEGVETEATPLPWCRRVCSGRPATTECFRQNRVRIQDLGSQRVPPLLALGPQDRFLDVCAAPGGKMYQALEQRGEGAGFALAGDISLQRLQSMRRLATQPVAMAVWDAARPLPLRDSFDRILVDAPCSGTGTLARNPEIKWRLRPDDLAVQASRQREILARSLACLAPGGRLVYSTCSLEPEENQDVVEAIGSAYEKVEERLWLPGENEGDGFYACVLLRTRRSQAARFRSLVG